VLSKKRLFSVIGASSLVVGALGGGSTALATTHTAQAAPTAKEMSFAGTAFGSEVNVASTVESGRSALSTLGCTSETGITHTNSVASVGSPGILTTGTVATSAASETVTGGVASSSSATTQGASLLGGLLSVTTIQSVSTTSRASATKTYSTSAAGTEFLDLSVLGIPISGTPAPNTQLTLPGVGYVVLNQQTSAVYSGSAHLTVIGIHVYVTLSTPLAPVGTQIIVSEANSSLGGPVTGLLGGVAYGASANVASTIIAGEEFPEPLGCLGTHGVTRTNSGVAVSVPGLLSTGTVTDTAEGTTNSKTAAGQVSSTVQGLNLLAGLVTATAINSDVTANGNPPALANNSTFLGLTVAGFPGVTDTPAPNTKLNLAGLGTLWLNRQQETANRITVIAIQLVVKVPSNPLGIAPGTTVNIAYASIGIH
jgi:hypothetical protein